MFERKLSREEMELLRQIEKFVRHKHSTSEGHDYSHVLQVTKYAIEIAKNIEERVDPFILICGALFHDIGRIGTITGVLHGFRGAGTATGYLRACGVEDEVIEKVGRVVIRHTRTSMMSPERVEEKIVYDADGLDRLGLIGMVRGLIGKSGSIQDILTDRIEKRSKDFDKLYFEESRKIGERLQKETLMVSERFKKALDEREESVENLELPI
ncbi:MAG: HD domain-containing protein [Candidatus Methanofastidiosia archaeon]